MKPRYPRSPTGYPLIFQFIEKHGSRFFIVKNDEEVDRLCNIIVKQRSEDGWYDDLHDLPAVPNKPSYLIATGALELKGEAAIAALEEISKHYAWAIKVDAMTESLSRLNEALKGTPSLAYQFLLGRTNHEYEDFLVNATESY